MAAGIKKFNWVKRPSTWEFAQAWRSQRSAMTQKFLEQGATMSTAFANAHQNHLTGIGTLAAQAAIQLAQKQAKAKAQNSINQLV